MQNWPGIRHWLTTHALPLWAEEGFDRTTATFVERLTLDGTAISAAPRRLMVQARQIYSYASAEQHGWISGAGDLAARAARAMVRLYHQADGNPGWISSINSSGQVMDDSRDLYAHSFALLGLAAAFRCTGDEFYLSLADKTLSFLDAAMTHKHGGYYPVSPSLPKLVLTQNPHMHLLEALLALYEVAPTEDYKRRARAVVTLFETAFFSKATDTLTEYFEDRWTPADTGKGLTFEPGHHYEWVWLLNRFSRLFSQPISPCSDALQRTAARHGSSVKGLLWSEVRSDGVIIDPSFRLWPHTEAVKASLIRGDRDAADRWLGRLDNAFLRPAYPGGWHERIDSDGKLLVDYIPASSFYHLVCAFSACECA